MKFGSKLESERIEGWRYIDYTGLKNMLKRLVSEGQARDDEGGTKTFAKMLGADIRAVEFFLNQKATEAREDLDKLKHDLNLVESWMSSGYPDIQSVVDKIQNGLTELGWRVARLLKYVDLNVTGTRKILKKYDHVTGHHAGVGLLAQEEGISLERLSDPFELTGMVLSIQECLERTLVTRNALLRKRHSKRELLPQTGNFAIDSDENDTEEPSTEGWSRPVRLETQHSSVWTEDHYNVQLDESAMRVDSFLSRQLLVSRRIFAKTAQKLDLQVLRDTRVPPKFSTNYKMEQQMKHRSLMSAQRYDMLSVSIVLLLCFLYNGNVHALAPLSIFYADVTRAPLSSSVISIGCIPLGLWLCMFQLTEMVLKKKGGLILPTCLTSVALLVANLSYVSVFSGVPIDTLGRNATNDTILDGQHHEKHADFRLVNAFLLFGVAGFLGSILPVISVSSSLVVQSRKVEVVASSMVLSSFVGAFVGRGISTCSTSVPYEAYAQFIGFPVSGISVPTLGFALIWLVVVLCSCIPLVAAWILHSIGWTRISSSVRESTLKWANLAYQPPSPSNDSGIYQREYSGLPVSVGMLIQAVSLFTQTIIHSVLMLYVQLVFAASWPLITVVNLALTASPLLMLCVTLGFIRWQGSWIVLRTGIFLSVFCAAALLPLTTVGGSYTLLRFFFLNWFLSCLSHMVDFSTCVRLSYKLEEFPHLAPFKSFGFVGPMLSLQSARCFGQFMSFALVSFALNLSNGDPTAVLNTCFTSVMVLQALLLFILIFYSV